MEDSDSLNTNNVLSTYFSRFRKSFMDPRNSWGETLLLWADRNNSQQRPLTPPRATLDIDSLDHAALVTSGPPISKRDKLRFISAARLGMKNDVTSFLHDFNTPIVNVTDNEGRSALMWACENRHYEIVSKLLRAGARLDARDNKGQSALGIASERGHLQVVSMLVSEGATVETTDNDGNTALILASEKGHSEVVRTLICSGAVVNGRNKEGCTALIKACSNGHVAVVFLLLTARANVELKDLSGFTALLAASMNGHDKVITMLVTNHAKIEAIDHEGRTSLVVASRNGHLKAVSALLSEKAKVEVKDKEGWTPLIWASCNGHDSVVAALVNAGANTEAKNSEGCTALIISSSCGHLKTVSILLSARPELETTNNRGQTALLRASENGYHEVVSELLKAGANIEAKNALGWTSLLQASQNGHQIVVSILLSYGAKVNVTADNGWTALMIASANGHNEEVSMLLRAQANVDANNPDGMTAFDLAKNNEVRNLIKPPVPSNDGFINLHRVKSAQLLSSSVDRLYLIKKLNDSDDEFLWHEIDNCERIANGALSKIYSIRCEQQHRVMKIIDCQSGINKIVENLQKLSQIPHIPKIYGYSFEQHVCTLIMDFIPNGTLAELLRDFEEQLSWKQKIEIAINIVVVMKSLHENGVVYGDLKSSKILMGEDLQPKLSLSTGLLYGHPAALSSESFRWMAPELHHGNRKCSLESDMYSLGMVIWEISSRCIPFEDTSLDFIPYLIVSGQREALPEDCPVDLANIITACWDQDGSKRSTAAAVLRSLMSCLSRISSVPTASSDNLIDIDADFDANLPVEKEKVNLHLNSSRMFEIQFLEVDILRLIERGTFSKIYRCNLKRNLEVPPLAIKIIVDTRLDTSKLILNLKKLSQLSCFPMICSLTVEPRISIIMEYISSFTLFDLLRSDTPLDWDQRIQISTQIAKALETLHDNGFVYGDLKSSKILMSEDFLPKLCLSTGLLLNHNLASPRPSQRNTTLSWAAPELFQKDTTYTKESDVYSLGMVLWEISSRRFPFQSSLVSVLPYLIVSGQREALPEDCPVDLARVINDLWAKDMNQRPTAGAVVGHLQSLLFNINSINDRSFDSQDKSESRIKRHSCYQYDDSNYGLNSFVTSFEYHTKLPISNMKVWRKGFSQNREQGNNQIIISSPLKDFLTSRKSSPLKDFLTSRKSKFLGQGLFCDVRKANMGGEKVVVKELRFRVSLEVSHNNFELIKKDIDILKRLQHLNILRYHDFSHTPPFIIAMECMEQGTLHDHLLKEGDKFTWEQVIRIAKDITSGLHFLHSNDIIHGAVISSNVYFGGTRKEACKLTGFSLLKYRPLIQYPINLNNCVDDLMVWMAPELFDKGTVCTKQSDVYSLGLLIWQLLCGRNTLSCEGPRKDFIKQRYKMIKDCIPQECPLILSSLVASCCNSTPDKRPDTWTMDALWFRVIENNHHLDLSSLLSEPVQEINDTNSLLETLTPVNVIGHGSYGDVFKTNWQNKVVAIKKSRTGLINTDKGEIDLFENEVILMKSLQHPNIVHLYGFFYHTSSSSQERSCYIVMEYMSKGSLTAVLHSNDEYLPWLRIIQIAVDITRGLCYLHLNNIVHRDLKSGNVLIGGNFKACLCDFGLSRIKSDMTTSQTSTQTIGTIRWMAPELFQEGALYFKESDVYSLGITFWELVTRKIPFHGIAVSEHAVPQQVITGIRDEIPKECPDNFAIIITRCWDGDPKKRPNVQQVLQSLLQLIKQI